MAARRHGPLITDRDRALLGFAAEHRIVLAAHFQTLLGVSASVAYARLRALSGAGLLRRQPVVEPPGSCFSITRRGLTAIGSALPVPRLDAGGFRHDIGLAWLWLGARGGAFGPLRSVVSERRMRSADAAEAYAARIDGAAVEPFGIRLGGLGASGRERLHYPDLLLLGPHGGRLAVELELTAKARTRRELILAGYAAERRIDGVLYVVERRSVGSGIERAAARMGAGTRVAVQLARWGPQGTMQRGGAPLERSGARVALRGVEAGR